MKIFVMICALVFSTSALASQKTKLRIPLVNDGDKRELLSTYNAKFKKLGLKAVPDYVEVADKDDWNDATKPVEKTLDIANKKLGLELSIALASVPEEFSDKKQGYSICYVGEGTEVAGVVGDLADIPFSDQINVWGWRYKDQKWLDGNFDEKDLDKDKCQTWNEWRGKGEAVLVMTSYGDDGDDVEENIIPLCQ
jgi:hypothetical protein